MASVTPRFCWANFAQFSNAVLVVSSEQSTSPGSYVTNPLRSKMWKSAMGWTIVAGFNDKLDINESTTGDATATLTPGTYATGALLAAELTTQMNSAATDNTYTWTYDGGTNKFSVVRATGSTTWRMEWATGANTLTSVGLDLGFDVSSNDSGLGAGTLTADNVSYQSRHELVFTLNAAMGVSFGAVLDHNLSATGTVTLEGNASDAWTAPSFTQVLDEEDTPKTIRSKFFAEQSFQYWRFLINDVQSPLGVNSLGLVHFGGYFQPSVAHGVEMGEGRSELSQVLRADQGAVFINIKPSAKVFTMEFIGVLAADRDNFHSMQDNRKQGRPFFLFWDPQNTAGDGDYYKFSGPISSPTLPSSPMRFRIQVGVEQCVDGQ